MFCRRAAAMMLGSKKPGLGHGWRPASRDLVRRVGKWVLLSRPGRATCDSFVPWFLVRVHHTALGELGASTGIASGSASGIVSGSASADDTGEDAAACAPNTAGMPRGAASRESPVDSSVHCAAEPGAAHEARSGAADIADPDQGETRLDAPTEPRQAACEAAASNAAGTEVREDKETEAHAQGGPAKRRKPGGSSGRASTKRGRREARAPKSMPGTFLVVMNSQGRRMVQLVTATLQWKPAERPDPCVFADADMLAGTVEPVDPIWERAIYACPYGGCGRPSWYEDLCEKHAVQVCGCRVQKSAVAGLGVFAARDIHPPAAGFDGDVLLFPYGGVYHLEADMQQYLRRPGTPAKVADYLFTVPGTGVVIDGCTCRSLGSMLNSTTADKANCAFVHMVDSYRSEAAVFVACIRPIRRGQELLVCYNNADWARMLGQEEK